MSASISASTAWMRSWRSVTHDKLADDRSAVNVSEGTTVWHGNLPCGVEHFGVTAVRSFPVAALIIGISGGSGSGKSRLASDLANELGPERVSLLPFDAYYEDLSRLPFKQRCEVNFDHPDALDVETFGLHLDALRRGMDVALPVYDFSEHKRLDDLIILPARDIIIAEGILLFAFPELVERMDFRIYRRCSSEIRFSRRLERDMLERGRSAPSVAEQFETSVAPMHREFVEPSAEHAHRIVEQHEDLGEVVAELAASVQAIHV